MSSETITLITQQPNSTREIQDLHADTATHLSNDTAFDPSEYAKNTFRPAQGSDRLRPDGQTFSERGRVRRLAHAVAQGDKSEPQSTNTDSQWERRFGGPGRTLETTLDPLTVENISGEKDEEEERVEEITQPSAPDTELSLVQGDPQYTQGSISPARSLPPGCSLITADALREVGQILAENAYLRSQTRGALSDVNNHQSTLNASNPIRNQLQIGGSEKETTISEYMGIATSLASSLVGQAAMGYFMGQATGVFGSAVSALGSMTVNNLVVPTVQTAASFFH